jgi:hypothetical protein
MTPRRWEPKRWLTPFAIFVHEIGCADLARALGCTRGAVYHWIRAITEPSPTTAQKIVEFARKQGRELSMEQIYQHTRAVREEKRRQQKRGPKGGRKRKALAK